MHRHELFYYFTIVSLSCWHYTHLSSPVFFRYRYIESRRRLNETNKKEKNSSTLPLRPIFLNVFFFLSLFSSNAFFIQFLLIYLRSILGNLRSSKYAAFISVRLQWAWLANFLMVASINQNETSGREEDDSFMVKRGFKASLCDVFNWIRR